MRKKEKTFTEQVLEELKEHEPRGMHEHQLPVVWVCASNDKVVDIDDRCYIDFTSGIFVTNVGHGTIAYDVGKQMHQLIHCYTFPHTTRLNLAKKIKEVTGFEKAFFLSSGSEANDCAVKIMRMYRKAPVIVSIKGAMHGKTMCAEKLRGDDGTNGWAIDHDPGFYHLEDPFEGSFDSDMAVLLHKRHPKDIAGFLIESYRGWNAKFYDKKYMKNLADFALKWGIPLCFDEVQGGFGRTGKLFAYKHYGVIPNMVCVGKGLGGGLPISAVLGPSKMLDIPDDLSSTHSANPVCSRAALVALDYYAKKRLDDLAEAKGEIMFKVLENLKKYKFVKEINGKGLLAAIVFDDVKRTDRIIYNAMEKGLLMVRTGRESIKIGPPLTITISALMEGLKILEECIREERRTKKTHSKVSKNI